MGSGSTEWIEVGALRVRFLVEASDSNGSASVFECFVATRPVGTPARASEGGRLIRR